MYVINPSMEAIWLRWLQLFDATGAQIDHERLAAPFFSCGPPDKATVLYVGKATGGSWHRDKFQRTVKERLECTSKWIEAVRNGEYRSAYWHLFLELEARAALNDRDSAAVWTNICKIGVLQGNPRAHYLAFQRKLAIETLRLEIETYRPRLVFFVTGDYADDVVM